MAKTKKYSIIDANILKSNKIKNSKNITTIKNSKSTNDTLTPKYSKILHKTKLTKNTKTKIKSKYRKHNYNRTLENLHKLKTYDGSINIRNNIRNNYDTNNSKMHSKVHYSIYGSKKGGAYNFITRKYKIYKFRKYIDEFNKESAKLNKQIDSYKLQTDTFKNIADKKASEVSEFINNYKKEIIIKILLTDKITPDDKKDILKHNLNVNISSTQQIEKRLIVSNNELTKEIPTLTKTKKQFDKDSKKFRELLNKFTSFIEFQEYILNLKFTYDKIGTEIDKSKSYSKEDKTKHKEYKNHLNDFEYIAKFDKTYFDKQQKDISSIDKLFEEAKHFKSEHSALDKKKKDKDTDLQKWKADYEKTYVIIADIIDKVKKLKVNLNTVKESANSILIATIPIYEETGNIRNTDAIKNVINSITSLTKILEQSNTQILDIKAELIKETPAVNLTKDSTILESAINKIWIVMSQYLKEFNAILSTQTIKGGGFNSCNGDIVVYKGGGIEDIVVYEGGDGSSGSGSGYVDGRDIVYIKDMNTDNMNMNMNMNNMNNMNGIYNMSGGTLAEDLNNLDDLTVFITNYKTYKANDFNDLNTLFPTREAFDNVVDKLVNYLYKNNTEKNTFIIFHFINILNKIYFSKSKSILEHFIVLSYVLYKYISVIFSENGFLSKDIIDFIKEYVSLKDNIFKDTYTNITIDSVLYDDNYNTTISDILVKSTNSTNSTNFIRYIARLVFNYIVKCKFMGIYINIAPDKKSIILLKIEKEPYHLKYNYKDIETLFDNLIKNINTLLSNNWNYELDNYKLMITDFKKLYNLTLSDSKYLAKHCVPKKLYTIVTLLEINTIAQNLSLLCKDKQTKIETEIYTHNIWLLCEILLIICVFTDNSFKDSKTESDILSILDIFTKENNIIDEYTYNHLEDAEQPTPCINLSNDNYKKLSELTDIIILNFTIGNKEKTNKFQAYTLEDYAKHNIDTTENLKFKAIIKKIIDNTDTTQKYKCIVELLQISNFNTIYDNFKSKPPLPPPVPPTSKKQIHFVDVTDFKAKLNSQKSTKSTTSTLFIYPTTFEEYITKSKADNEFNYNAASITHDYDASLLLSTSSDTTNVSLGIIVDYYNPSNATQANGKYLTTKSNIDYTIIPPLPTLPILPTSVSYDKLDTSKINQTIKGKPKTTYKYNQIDYYNNAYQVIYKYIEANSSVLNDIYVCADKVSDGEYTLQLPPSKTKWLKKSKEIINPDFTDLIQTIVTNQGFSLDENKNTPANLQKIAVDEAAKTTKDLKARELLKQVKDEEVKKLIETTKTDKENAATLKNILDGTETDVKKIAEQIVNIQKEITDLEKDKLNNNTELASKNTEITRLNTLLSQTLDTKTQKNISDQIVGLKNNINALNINIKTNTDNLNVKKNTLSQLQTHLTTAPSPHTGLGINSITSKYSQSTNSNALANIITSIDNNKYPVIHKQVIAKCKTIVDTITPIVATTNTGDLQSISTTIQTLSQTLNTIGNYEVKATSGVKPSGYKPLYNDYLWIKDVVNAERTDLHALDSSVSLVKLMKDDTLLYNIHTDIKSANDGDYLKVILKLGDKNINSQELNTLFYSSTNNIYSNIINNLASLTEFKRVLESTYKNESYKICSIIDKIIPYIRLPVLLAELPRCIQHQHQHQHQQQQKQKQKQYQQYPNFS